MRQKERSQLFGIGKGGGGGARPQMYRQKKDSPHVTYMRERAPHYISFQVSKYLLHLHVHIQSIKASGAGIL